MRHAHPLRCGLLLAAALLVPACSSGDTGSEAGDGAGDAAPDRSTGGTPRAETSALPALRAADGSDVSACREADCEILVDGTADVPLASRFGVTDFQVTYEKPNKVTFDYARPETRHVAEIKGTGFLGLADGVKVTIKDVDDTGAVLRFAPETVDPANDQAGGSHGVYLHTEG